MQLRLTKAVKALIIICFVAFVIQQTADQFFGTQLISIFGLVPSGFMMYGRIWQLFTYAFLHGDVMHLFLNMMMLLFIGSELEAVWGTARFVRFYFFCSVSAGLVYLGLQVFLSGSSLNVPMVGASGAIYGLLIAYGMLFGERVLLFMLLFPMKAKVFIWVLALIEFMSTVFSARAGVAGAAHLGGMAAGWIYLWLAPRIGFPKRGGRGRAAKKKRSADHLRLVVNRDRDGEGPNGEPKIWH